VFSDQEAAVIDEHTAGYVVGDPAGVRAGLDALLAETQADELMLSTSTFRHRDRVESYELVAGLYNGVV